MIHLFIRILRRKDMSNAQAHDHPEEQEDAIIIPHVIRHPLNQERQNTAENTETYLSVGMAHCGFAKAE